MSILVPFNGVNYIIPTPGETGWGSNLDSFFVAIGAGCLQKIGGSFLLASEVDFGASFGLKALYYKAETGTIATTGTVRLASADPGVVFRNNANSGNLVLTTNSSDQLLFNGTPIGGSGIFTANRAIISNGTGDLVVSSTTSTEIGYVAGVTSSIQTQLNSKATDSLIVHLAGTETITGTKTFTASQTTFGDGSIGAPGIAFVGHLDSGLLYGTKVAISNDGLAVASFSDAQTTFTNGLNTLALHSGASGLVFSGAPIGNTVASGTPEFDWTLGASTFKVQAAPVANRTYTIPDAGGSANFLLSGWGQIVNADVNASAAITYSKLNLTGGIVNADVNAAAAIAYSKLNLSASIVNADIASGAAIARSKIAAGTAWRLLADDGSGNITEISFGANGQVLTSAGATTLPSFQNVSGTGTVNSGTAGRLSLYASSSNVVSDTYVQNSQNITLAIAAQASRSAGLAITIPNPGNAVTTANVLLDTDTGTHTIAGTWTLSAALSISPTTNQLVLGTTRTVTLSATQPASASRTYTFPDAGGNANIVMDNSNYTIAGAWTFSGNAGFGGIASAHDPLESYGLTSSVFRGQASFYDTTTGHGAGVGGQVVFGGIYTGSSQTEFGSIQVAKDNSTDANLDAKMILRARSNASGMLDMVTIDAGTLVSKFASNISFNATSTQGIVGTTTNDSAAAGNVGEVISSATSGSATTSGNYGDVTSISLTAGDWLVCMNLTGFVANGGTFNSLAGGISTTSGNSAAGLTTGDNQNSCTPTAGASQITGSVCVVFYHVKLTGTTIHYLKYQAGYATNTPTIAGRITAVRIR